jgi:glutathione S-transferase
VVELKFLLNPTHKMSLWNNFSVYTAGALFNSPHSGLMPIVIVSIFVLDLWMGIMVALARKKYNIQYPTLYAVAGTTRFTPVAKAETEAISSSPLEDKSKAVITQEDAYAFNCVQRGHQNTVEKLPVVLAMLLVNWFSFPLPAAIAGFVWVAGRILYMIGYTWSPEWRNIGVISYFGLFSLLGLTCATAGFFYQKTAAY